jgi:mono/diheme cytochrome c family protein
MDAERPAEPPAAPPAPPPPRRPWRWLVLACVLAAALGVGVQLALQGPGAPPPAPVAELGEEALRRLAHDPAVVERGHLLWGSCVGCHGLQGQGAQGPNLRDDYWLHGSTMTDICRSIREGYPLKGMPAWGAAGVAAEDIHALAAYVASLHGTDDGHGKAPEGARQPITW